MDLDFRILNVFTDGDDPFSGNPLCVFVDGRGLTDEQMQALARQTNLSETTFVLPGALDADSGSGDTDTGGATASAAGTVTATATATVRIFTPNYELPFAGHPTLGTAHVVRGLADSGNDVVLRMRAGDIPVTAEGDRWTLRANPATSTTAGDPADVAAAAGLPAEAVAGQPLWVDTGTIQLVLPVRSADDVQAAVAVPELMRQHATRVAGQSMLYLWAPTGEDTIEARMFFAQGGSYPEDPATGSACANLGGWFLANDSGPIHRTVRQGGAVGRPSVLELDVDAAGTIRVSGAVREVARGTFTI